LSVSVAVTSKCIGELSDGDGLGFGPAPAPVAPHPAPNIATAASKMSFLISVPKRACRRSGNKPL